MADAKFLDEILFKVLGGLVLILNIQFHIIQKLEEQRLVFSSAKLMNLFKVLQVFLRPFFKVIFTCRVDSVGVENVIFLFNRSFQVADLVIGNADRPVKLKYG